MGQVERVRGAPADAGFSAGGLRRARRDAAYGASADRPWDCGRRGAEALHPAEPIPVRSGRGRSHRRLRHEVFVTAEHGVSAEGRHAVPMRSSATAHPCCGGTGLEPERVLDRTPVAPMVLDRIGRPVRTSRPALVFRRGPGKWMLPMVSGRSRPPSGLLASCGPYAWRAGRPASRAPSPERRIAGVRCRGDAEGSAPRPWGPAARSYPGA